MPGKPFIHEVCSVQVATLVFSGYLGRRGHHYLFEPSVRQKVKVVLLLVSFACYLIQSSQGLPTSMQQACLRRCQLSKAFTIPFTGSHCLCFDNPKSSLQTSAIEKVLY